MPIQQMFLGAGGPPPAEPLGALPVSGALWYYDGYYFTNSGGSLTWTDQSGNGRHMSTAGGRMGNNIAQDEASKGQNYLTNSRKFIKNTVVSDGMRWNGSSGYWPGTSYTLMHIMGRQLTSGTGSIGRIWDGFGINWLSGYHDTSEGVFYHDGWITTTNLNTQTSFLVIIDRKDKVRAKGLDYQGNGVDSGYQSSSGRGAPTTANGVGINCGNYSGDINSGSAPPGGEASFWKSIMCACWNGDIGDTDCNTLINWGYNKLYG